MSIPQVLWATPHHLLGELDNLFVLILSRKILVRWCVKVVFRLQVHTNPVPSTPPLPYEGLVEAQLFGKGILIIVDRGYERIVPVLDHASSKTYCEGLHRSVKASQHFFYAPPTNETFCVGVDLGN